MINKKKRGNNLFYATNGLLVSIEFYMFFKHLRPTRNHIQKSADKNGVDTSISKDVNEEINKVKDGLKDFTGSVRRNL